MSESWQAVERAVCGEEAESEHRRVVLVGDVHASGAGERPQFIHVTNSHRHVALGAADREVVLVAVLSRLPGKVELDAGEWELERDASVVDGALPLDGQRRRRHRHPQVHGREPAVCVCRVAARRRHSPRWAYSELKSSWPSAMYGNRSPKLLLSCKHATRRRIQSSLQFNSIINIQ